MSVITLVAPDGRIHGLIEELANDSKQEDFEKINPKIKSECEKRRKEDARIVKARYINHHEGPIGVLDKAYCRWAGDRIQKWRLLHDQVYDLPMGLVNEINNGSWSQGAGIIQRSKEDGPRDTASKKGGSNMRIHELVPCSF